MTNITPELAAALAINATAQQARQQFATQFQNPDQAHPQDWGDFGYKNDPVFSDYYALYSRTGVGNAAVDMPVAKCWETSPCVESTDAFTQALKIVERKTQIWQRLKGLDRRQRVGRYAGMILFVADGLTPDKPVKKVSGPQQLIKLLPVFEGQLTVTETEKDRASPRFSQPTMYTYNESGQGNRNTRDPQSFSVHWSRVVVWAEGADDGSIWGVPTLEAGYNDLINLGRIVGAGGLGHWKAARGSLLLNINPESNIQSLAAEFGVSAQELTDSIDEQVKEFNAGYNKSFITQGIDAKQLTHSLPDPDKPFQIALQDFAAAVQIPLTILVGHLTGERASEENSKQWCMTCESRRENFINHGIDDVLERLVEIGVLPRAEWEITWQPLIEPSPSERIERGKKMAELAKALVGTAVELPFDIGQQIADILEIPEEDREVFDTQPGEEEGEGELSDGGA